MSDQDLIAAFLARNAVTVAPSAPAYGVDPSADKARRQAQREAARYERAERDHEQYAEAIREAYHTGGRHAAIDAMQPRARW